MFVAICYSFMVDTQNSYIPNLQSTSSYGPATGFPGRGTGRGIFSVKDPGDHPEPGVATALKLVAWHPSVCRHSLLLQPRLPAVFSLPLLHLFLELFQATLQAFWLLLQTLFLPLVVPGFATDSSVYLNFVRSLDFADSLSALVGLKNLETVPNLADS